MALMTYADFIATYPEFAVIATDPTAPVTQQLTLADSILSDGAFGGLRNYAVGLVTAHRLALRYAPTQGTLQARCKPGVEASQSISPQSVSITVAHSALVTADNAWQADYSRTDYGLEYLTLLDSASNMTRVTGVAEDDTME